MHKLLKYYEDLHKAPELSGCEENTCGYLMAQKTGHLHINHLTKVEAKPAGCTEDGNTDVSIPQAETMGRATVREH